MAAKLPADINLRLTMKADLKRIFHAEKWPPSLGRRRTTFVGGLQHPYGTRVKPASFSLRLKTLLPLRRGIRQTVFLPSVNKLVPVMTLTGNGFLESLTDPYGGLKND